MALPRVPNAYQTHVVTPSYAQGRSSHSAPPRARNEIRLEQPNARDHSSLNHATHGDHGYTVRIMRPTHGIDRLGEGFENLPHVQPFRPRHRRSSESRANPLDSDPEFDRRRFDDLREHGRDALSGMPSVLRGAPKGYICAPADIAPYARLRADVLDDFEGKDSYLSAKRGNRYPKPYRNDGIQFDARGMPYTEYVDGRYGDRAGQNVNGFTKIRDERGNPNFFRPHSDRFLVDKLGHPAGVMFHPAKKGKYHQRASELYSDGSIYGFGDHQQWARIR